MSRVCITIALDEVTHSVMRERADSMGVSKSKFLRNALEWLLDKQPSEVTERGLQHLQDKQQQLRCTPELQTRIAEYCTKHNKSKITFYVTAIKCYSEWTLIREGKVINNLWRMYV